MNAMASILPSACPFEGWSIRISIAGPTSLLQLPRRPVAMPLGAETYAGRQRITDEHRRVLAQRRNFKQNTGI